MNVTFTDPGTTDTDKLCFSIQFVNSCTTGQSHARAQATHLLVNDGFQHTFVSHTAFDTFRHQFVSGVIGLEVTVRRTFGHRTE